MDGEHTDDAVARIRESIRGFDLDFSKSNPDLSSKIMEAKISSIERREISARVRPGSSNSPLPMYVPSGYGFYFSRAINNGWTDNKKNGVQPLEGWWFENKPQYIYSAARGQLVALTAHGWVGYKDTVDWSRGGGSWYVNRDETAWELVWYMNDSMEPDMYDDNDGTANIDVTIFRL